MIIHLEQVIMRNKVKEFEKEHGPAELLAIATVQNRILVKAGLISEKELKQMLQQELTTRNKKLESINFS